MTSVKKEVQLDSTALMGYLVGCQTILEKVSETVELLTLPHKVKDWFKDELDELRRMVTASQGLLY